MVIEGVDELIGNKQDEIEGAGELVIYRSFR